MNAKTKANEVKAIEFIKAKFEDSKGPNGLGMGTAKLRAYLLIEGFSTNDKFSNYLIAQAGISAARGSTGFRAKLYTRLIEGELSVEDFNEMLKGESKNTRKHSKHFWGIAALANTIRTGIEKESEMSDEADAAAFEEDNAA